MRSLLITLILFCLLSLGVSLNAVQVGRVCAELTARIERLPDPASPDCLPAVRALGDYWQARAEAIEFSAGYAAVDRITEQAELLYTSAACGDLYGYRTAYTLLLDAVEDLHRSERLSLATLL